MSADTEQLTEFQKGVRAMFDYLTERAANHWHSHQDLTAVCEKENALVLDWAEDGLHQLDESSFRTWKSIVDAQSRITGLTAQVVRLTHELAQYRDAKVDD